MIPQADESDVSAVVSDEFRDFRKYFSGKLNGKGLELGGLNSPMPKHEGMEVKYVDLLPIERLREIYPEFKDIQLQAPDIIGDAQFLENFSDNHWDFIIASHLIEHIPDPILAIENWMRVLKPGGLLYMVTPDKRKIFDKHRPRTRLAHLIGDYVSGPAFKEMRDWQHFVEYVDLVDNLFFGNTRSPKEILDHAHLLQKDNCTIHLHCFLPIDMKNMLEWMQANVVKMDLVEGPVMYKDECEFHCLLRKL